MIERRPVTRSVRRLDLLPDVEPFDTSEVRWFGAGKLPAAYVEWFTWQGRSGAVELRSDVYEPPVRAELGTKRRGGGPLEVKHRTGSVPGFAVDGWLTGTLEQWRKVTEPAVTSNGRRRERGWVAVDKVVVTRRYQLVGPNRLEEVADVEAGRPGCDVELASATVGGHEGWTYAFEAYGPAEEAIQVIRRAAAAVTAGHPYRPGFVAALACSAGYPEWLMSMAADRRTR